MPKFSAGFVLAGPDAALRLGTGSITIESNFFMGPGRVEFAAGLHSVLVPEFDAAVTVTGGVVNFEAPTFSIVDTNNREDERYDAKNRHRFALLGGVVNFTAVAPQFLVHGNMLLRGGTLAFPKQSAVSREFMKRRGLVHVVNRLQWDGSTMDGNCDLKSGGGMGIGGGTKTLKGLWRVINYAEAQWFSGDIVSDPGSRFVNRGTLESNGTDCVERRAVDGDEHHRGPAQFVHAWT